MLPAFAKDFALGHLREISPLRKAFFRTMQHSPPARKFMTRTMAGLMGA